MHGQQNIKNLVLLLLLQNVQWSYCHSLITFGLFNYNDVCGIEVRLSLVYEGLLDSIEHSATSPLKDYLVIEMWT